MNREGTRGRGATATVTLALCLLPLALTVTGCTRDFKYQPLGMWNGSRLKPMEGGPHGGPSMATRPPVPGTVARGQLRDDDPIRTGRSGGRLLTTSPIPITPAVLRRGQERYNVFCAPCHSRTGDGEGMIVKRSFPHPPDYATPRLRRAPIGHFYDVITNGYGVMYSYAERVPPTDRWAISAYIRVLQQNRPVVPFDKWETEREQARQTGIPDPRRLDAAGLERRLDPGDPALRPEVTDPTRGGTEIRDRSTGTTEGQGH